MCTGAHIFRKLLAGPLTALSTSCPYIAQAADLLI